MHAKIRTTDSPEIARRRGRAAALLVAAALAGFGAVPLTQAPAHANPLNGVWDFFKGKGGTSQRNADDKERIIAVLTHERVISYRDGRLEVNDSATLGKFYGALRDTGVFKNMPDYANDADGEKSGQFWRNFFDGKDHTQSGLPPVMDPFANANSGLATNMHTQLSSSGHLDAWDYADVAETLKMRRIDVLDTELRRGVATGADVMIHSLNAISGGTSGVAVKWMEEAAEAAKKAHDNPEGVARDYIKSKVSDEIKDLVNDKIKSAIGDDKYDAIMGAYEKYGDKQERLKAFMDDMYRRTGDGQFDALSKLVDRASTDHIADALVEKTKALIAPAPDKAGSDKDKKGQDKTADKDKAAGDKDSVDKDKTTDKDKAADKDKTADKGQSSAGDKTGAATSGDSGQSGKTVDKGAATSDKKPWNEMTNAEKREALKANDPAAWDAFGKLAANAPQQAVAILDAKKGASNAPPSDNGGTDTSSSTLGEAITDAGLASVEAASPTPTPTAAQAPAQPPQGTTKVDAGWLQDANGKTKVVYVNDANGNRIGGYYVHYDKQGVEIGRETFRETAGSPTQQQPAATLSGRYEGAIHGKSSGSIVVNVSGGAVSGSLHGAHEGDAFSATFSGALNGDGSFDVAASGVLQGNWGDHVTPYPLSGRVSGRVDGHAGAGQWSGKNQWGSDGGSWQASK